MRIKTYLIVIERAEGNYSAYAPDVPGCVATGRTIEETRLKMYEALQFHFEGLLEDGDPLPESTTQAEFLTIPIPETSRGALAQSIRAFVRQNYIEPARRSGTSVVKVPVKEVHEALQLHARFPAVVDALRAQTFSKEAGVRLLDVEGPRQSTTTILVFRLAEAA